VRCLLSELDAAGHTDTLEIIFLLSSDVIAADVKLGQRPIVGGYVRDVSLISGGVYDIGSL
jgi:hypothetical protein